MGAAGQGRILGMRPFDFVVAILTVGLLAVFVIASRQAAGGSSRAQAVAVMAGGLLALAAAIGTFFAFVIAGIKCDDTCDQSLEGGHVPWSEDPGAWHWWGQFALALTALVVAVVAWRQTARERHRRAIPCALAAAALLAGWAAFVRAGT